MVLWNFDLLWKNYMVLWKKLWYYGKNYENYDTLDKTMELWFTMEKKSMAFWKNYSFFVRVIQHWKMHASLPNNSKHDLLSHFSSDFCTYIDWIKMKINWLETHSWKSYKHIFLAFIQIIIFLRQKWPKALGLQRNVFFLFVRQYSVNKTYQYNVYVYSVNIMLSWETRNVHFHSLYPLFMYFPYNFRLLLSMNTTVLYLYIFIKF